MVNFIRATGADTVLLVFVKRETGESPVRSRHCKQGVWNKVHMHSHWETGKAVFM